MSSPTCPLVIVMAMNNIGVSLIKKAQFSAACVVLQDTLDVLKKHFERQASAAPYTNSSNAALQRATSLAQTCNKQKSHNLWITTACYSESALDDFYGVLRDGLLVNQVVPTSVDSADIDDTSQDSVAAIVLYNFGIAQFAMGYNSSRTSPDRVELYYHASAMLQKAQMVLANVDGVRRDQDCIDILHLSFFGLAASAHAQVLAEMGLHVEATAVLDNVDLIHDEIVDMQESLLYETTAKNAAAA